MGGGGGGGDGVWWGGGGGYDTPVPLAFYDHIHIYQLDYLDSKCHGVEK